MPASLCAACNQRVEEGSVRCPSCGSRLDLPGAFAQVLGWVFLGAAMIPLALSRLHTADVNYVPLAIAAGMVIFGVFLLVWGKVRSKSAPPTTVQDLSGQAPLDS